MKKDIIIEKKVPCNFYNGGVDVNHCMNCSFCKDMVYENNELIGVDCIKDEIPIFNGHVTSIQRGDKRYRVRYYDFEKDGEIDERVGTCKLCCFNREMSNGINVCLLRHGVDDSKLGDMFMCYEDELWEEVK